MLMPEIREKVKKHITESISFAVGDGILEDVQSKNLATRNGDPGRIWDILHTEIKRRLESYDILARPSMRGGWAILPMYDRETNTLLCCMRDNNFNLLSKRDRKKLRRHYIFALTYIFNQDLPFLQGSLLDYEITDSEKLLVNETIARILHDLNIPAGEVHRHALILFHASYGQLLKVRCCAVNSNLEIIGQDDWSKFIPTVASAIVEVEPTDNSPKHNNRSQPMKGKAIKRIAEREIGKL